MSATKRRPCISRLFPLGCFAAVALAGGVLGGCSGSSNGTTGVQTGTGGTVGAAGAGAGGAQATGGAAGADAGTDAAATGAGGAADAGASDAAAPVTAKTIVLPISPTGPDRFYGVTYDRNGNIFATGQVASSNDSTADYAMLLAKFSPAGVLDPTFGAGGLVVRNVVNGTNGELFRGVAVQSTGKVVVAGMAEHLAATDPRDRDIYVLRFNADGTKDTTFGTDGIVIVDLSTGVVNGNGYSADSAWGLSVYPNDRLVISGGQVHAGATDTDFALVRLNADGTRDTTFGTGGVFTLDTLVDGTTTSNNASPRNASILPGTEGIIGAGYQPSPGADTRPVLYKVSDAGVLDPTFGTNGVFSTPVLAEQTECYAAAVQPTGVAGGYNLVTTGYGRALATETTDFVSLRLDSHGVLDTTYGTGGVVRVDIGGFADNSRKLAILPDGRILLVGGGRLSAADVDGVVALLKPDGQPDPTFGPQGWMPLNLGGPADFLWAVALSPDGKTAAVAGIKGVGANPTPPAANDDAALIILPLGS